MTGSESRSAGPRIAGKVARAPDNRDTIPAETWERRTAGDLAREWGLTAVHLFTRVGSTNDVARTLAGSGAPSGTLVLADAQTAGRGRAGRRWASPPGLGLWGSLVIRGIPGDAIGAYPLRVGIAIARALDPWLPTPPTIKWPNDLLVDDRKLGGILCEGTWDNRLVHLVVGVGINVLQRSDDLPPDLRETATSLRMTGADLSSRLEVATAVWRALGELAASPDAPLDLAEMERRDGLRGRRIEVIEPQTGRRLRSGIAEGIAADGALRIRTSAGTVRVRTGSVRAIGSDSPTPAGAPLPGHAGESTGEA